MRDGDSGTTPKKLQHLLSMFYRAGKTGHVLGTGIELAIATGLVEAHGGRLGIESRVKEWSAL